MKYRIKFFSDYATSDELKQTYESINEIDKMENYGKDKDIYITTENDYTHAIIINFGMPELKDISKNNVVGLGHEPTLYFVYLTNKSTNQYILLYAEKYIDKYFMGDRVFNKPFIPHFSYMPHNKPMRTVPIKNKLISIIISEKNDIWFGYCYRYKIVELILKYNYPIDIYGRGSTQFLSINNEIIKGEFVENEPYEKYEFHICIENFECDHYFSEKIINPLLTSTIPIYLGCRNIKDYFGENVIIMSGNIEKDMNLITDILYYPDKYRRIIDTNAIKNKVSLLRNLDNIFS